MFSFFPGIILLHFLSLNFLCHVDASDVVILNNDNFEKEVGNYIQQFGGFVITRVFSHWRSHRLKLQLDRLLATG